MEVIFLFLNFDVVVFRIEEGEKLEDNKRHLMLITQKVFNAIVESAHSYVIHV